MKRKICVITGTRAEFGLMQWILHLLANDSDFELQLVVTGMHLSPEFGMTINDIKEKGFKIDKKIEILLSSDSSVGISKSMGLGMISFSEAFDELSPDLILVLGDRFEIFAAVSSAMVSRIPVAHLHGGEATEGLIDEPIRHSITKMAHLHFTATSKYRERVIQLGESPDRVFNTGTPGLDNIYKLNLLDRKQFEDSIDFNLSSEINFLVTFHPVTLEKGTAGAQFQELLNSLDQFNNAKIIFTKPNADTGGRVIIDMIDDYVSKYKDKSCAFTSLGQVRYLSALKHTDVVIGNSSSGLVEAPAFLTPTIDIGDRQKGRINAKSVINVKAKADEITQAIKTALSKEFKKSIENMANPYGDGGASEKIVEILKETNLDGIIKKKFHDL